KEDIILVKIRYSLNILIPCFFLFLLFPSIAHTELIISGINILGNFPIFEKELQRVINIRIGEEYYPDVVKEVAKKIEKIYQDEGYDSVRVEHTLEETEPGLATLNFIIHKGPRTKIREMSIFDDSSGKKPNIEFLLGLREGLVFKRKKFKARLSALEEQLVRMGYLRADVRYEEDLKDHEVSLKVYVYRGPKLGIEIKGNRYFTNEEILETLTFYENRFFDTLEAEESVERITDLYRDNGFIDAEVGFSWNDPDFSGDRKIVFNISEGKRTYLKDIIFEHGGYLKKKRLKRQFLSIRSLSIFRSRPFKAITFSKDLEALEALYRSEGFPNVRISTKTERRGKRIKKRIIINEGIRIMVRNVSFKGNDAFSDDRLKSILKVKERDPLRPKEFQDDRRQLTIFYGNNGYAYVKVSVDMEKDEEKGFADILYKINEGPFVSFGKIDIKRNFKTKEKIIRLATSFKQGDTFSYQKILDTHARLSRLGLFRSLSVEPKGMDTMSEDVDCIIEVEEMKTGKVNLGAGFSSRLGYRGYMEIREDNLWGRAISARFKADFTGLGGGSRITDEIGRSSKYTITFRDPLLIPRHKIEGEGSIYTSTEDRREYHNRSNGLEFGIWRPYKRKLRIGLIYHIDLNRLDDITIDKDEIPEEYEEHTISAIGPAIIYDSRDNFLDPYKGIYTNLSLDHAGRWIGGDQDFYKIKAEYRTFFPLNSRLVMALSIRGGYIGIYGKTSKVPIQERFFAGGGNTVRGFKEDSIGPKDDDTGLPLGGRVFWINNLEFRYPIYKSIKAVIFYDTGNVWDSRKEEDFPDLRQGAGIGVRWITPIGPVRLDYGRAIDRRPGESLGRFYLSVGHAF
ncbi:MAG: outer membrane protein assembly factor BamA, partial [bacterium]